MDRVDMDMEVDEEEAAVGDEKRGEKRCIDRWLYDPV